MTALSKSVELDGEQVEYIAKKPDLEGLSSLPAFKKMISEVEKQ